MTLSLLGIVPRAIRKLFEDLNECREKNPSYKFEVYVSFLELYNEELVDLLNPQSRENNKKGKSELMIREDASGQIYWAGVKEVLVSSPEELIEYVSRYDNNFFIVRIYITRDATFFSYQSITKRFIMSNSRSDRYELGIFTVTRHLFRNTETSKSGGFRRK